MKRALRLLILCASSSALAAPLPAGYAELLSVDKIAFSIIWDGEMGALPYPKWTDAEKADLARAIGAREAGQPAGLSEPPRPLGAVEPPDLSKPGSSRGQELEDESTVFISSRDAWSLFLAHAAHSLWLERHAKVPWSLKKMSGHERALLLDSRRLQERGKTGGAYRVSRYLMGHALSWDPAVAYRFLEENGMLGAAPEKTVLAAAGWANMFLRHVYDPQTFEGMYGYAGPPPLDRILYPKRDASRRVLGCWGVTGFFAALLRGANIPVENENFDKHHSRPVFPTARLKLRHGDDIYSTPVAASGNRIPPERIFITFEEWEKLVDAPVLDCEGKVCNTKEEQVAYNLKRRLLLFGKDFITDYAMSKYGEWGPAGFEESLRGERDDDGNIKYYAKPLLSEAERKALISGVEAELKRLGGGDLGKGQKIVDDRMREFYR